MRRFKKIAAIVFGLATALASCKKNDESSPSSSSAALITILENGRWSIIQLLDSTNDETSHFSGYEIVFTADGNATASKEGNSTSGIWSTENNAGVQKLLLNFSTYPFDELTNDWQITTQNDSLVRSEQMNAGKVVTGYFAIQKLH